MISKYLEKTNGQQNQLAELLNVSPSTLSTWISASNERAPTSTMELVMFSLLLGARIIDVPPIDEETYQEHVRICIETATLTPADLRDPEKVAQIRTVLAIRMGKYFKNSRQLYLALHESWAKIEAFLKAEKGVQI